MGLPSRFLVATLSVGSTTPPLVVLAVGMRAGSEYPLPLSSRAQRWISRRWSKQLRRRPSRWTLEKAIQELQPKKGTRSEALLRLYILSNAARTLYVGFTNGFERRIHKHCAKQVDSFTRTSNVTLLIHAEEFSQVGDALARVNTRPGFHTPVRQWNLIP